MAPVAHRAPRRSFIRAMADAFGLTRPVSTVAPSGYELMNWWWAEEPFDGPINRFEALSIPGVARSHHTLVSKGSQLEFVVVDGDDQPVENQPAFLERRDTGEPPEMRMWCTFDDLYFYGSSCWSLVRDRFAKVDRAQWVPRDRWRIDVDDSGEQVVLIDNVVRDPADYLIFNTPLWGGILLQGYRTLRGALDIERAWTARMRAPVQLVDLHVDKDSNLTQQEVDAYVQAWQKKHYAGAPAVGMTPPDITLNVHTGAIGPADLFVQARDTIRTDIGSHAGFDGAMVDSTGGTSSLTYETHEGQRADFYEFDLPFWTTPILSVLSRDDITPQGTRVIGRFRIVTEPQEPWPAPRQVVPRDTGTATQGSPA